ncbi:MAG TPA: hypothetical protein VF803_02310, partial [Candidatus Paceibacterota bacterium]
MLRKHGRTFPHGVIALSASILALVVVIGYVDLSPATYDPVATADASSSTARTASGLPLAPKLDLAAYNAKLLQISNIPDVNKAELAEVQAAGQRLFAAASTTAQRDSASSTTAAQVAKLLRGTAATAQSNGAASVWVPHSPWPVSTAYPKYGAILPFSRIVAYYGNFYSTKMGVLGEYPPDEMLARLRSVSAEWEAADPSTPVTPALDYIVVTAQGSAGADGKYRLRMPDSQIQKAIDLAEQVHGLVFLDVQVGLSDLKTELPLLSKYLAMPQVELSIDPEFSMKTGAKPGTVIGTFDASDVNYAANLLAGIVKENNLPPKVLVVHRFTEAMVTNYQDIQPLPEVQIVMDMDGWGSPAKKIGTYRSFVASEPVQFTGFKLFYKNDIKPPSTRMLTPTELLSLTPQPLY